MRTINCIIALNKLESSNFFHDWNTVNELFLKVFSESSYLLVATTRRTINSHSAKQVGTVGSAEILLK